METVGLTMSAKYEITRKYASQYGKASKRQRGQILDEVVGVTGWSRDNARRRLCRAGNEPAAPRGRSPGKKQRAPRPFKYSYDARKVLAKVWAVSQGQCGKYLAVAMPLLLDALESFNELAVGTDRYSQEVREELLAMSPATIDRYLKPIKDATRLTGMTTTKPSPLLRSSIRIRKAGDEIEAVPGFFEGDTVAHCGPTLKGEFARSLNLTDVNTGWTFTTSIRNNASIHIIAGLDRAIEALPIPITGVDFDNGTEFINYDVVAWAQNLEIYFTRSRPYKKNDQATIESKNNHVVRKYAHYWRYDTRAALGLLNRLWVNVNDFMNYFAPTVKPIGWSTDKTGRRKRLYDEPKTPFDRLKDSGTLTQAQIEEMTAYRASLNPAQLARNIATIQTQLEGIAKTSTLKLIDHTTPLLPATNGIKHAS